MLLNVSDQRGIVYPGGPVHSASNGRKSLQKEQLPTGPSEHATHPAEMIVTISYTSAIKPWRFHGRWLCLYNVDISLTRFVPFEAFPLHTTG